jgi:hypothetical protein
MKASWHTETMLAGWEGAGVDRADLALRRSSGAMLWQRNLALENLPLAWARAENAHGAEVYVRPARGMAWPMVFLDDVLAPLAMAQARSHGGMAIQTSPAGGCHLWLPCAQVLDEEARHQAQRWLAAVLGADLGSVSGEHLGRLAGFKNWKRGGCWVNVVSFPEAGSAAPLGLTVPPDVLESVTEPRCTPVGVTSARDAHGRPGGDSTPSGQDWNWACRMLESGSDPERTYRELVQRAWERRGQDAERYARRTVERALVKVRSRRG